jgi:VIT1/CCC1 family predicted Fe2+/Mn2+ transporter
MKQSLKTGLSFGLTSGIITTLGLIVGLNAGTGSRLTVIGGILTIAIADAMSDALGIHISEEAERKHTTREIWESTISTFITKFVFAITFIVPVLLLPLGIAIIVSIIWGLLLLGAFSFYIAKAQKDPASKIIAEHVLIAILVIVATNYIGSKIGLVFK